jgi:vacuolar-type H+-ATPase subunit E/Vma4
MAKAPAKKAAAKAPAKKAAAKAPAKKAAAKAPAKKAAAKAPATPNFTPDVEAAAERIKKTSDRVLALSKQNGLVWLEAYEKMLDGVLKLEEDAAKGLGSDWVEKLVSTQADFVRDTLRAYLSALKDRLK